MHYILNVVTTGTLLVVGHFSGPHSCMVYVPPGVGFESNSECIQCSMLARIAYIDDLPSDCSWTLMCPHPKRVAGWPRQTTSPSHPKGAPALPLYATVPPARNRPLLQMHRPLPSSLKQSVQNIGLSTVLPLCSHDHTCFQTKITSI